MSKVFWVVAAALLIGHASAQDYVARAHTSCAAVDGTARYGPCMTSAAQSICGSQALSERLSCYKDFERYALAKVDQAEAERRALAADVEQRMQRLRSKIQNSAIDSEGGYFNPLGNAGRTLDDGLPDMQPSWGTGGDPYARLRKFVALSDVPTDVTASHQASVDLSKVTCASMSTLAMAKDYLNRGAKQLDADNDGNPCEEKFARINR